MKVARQSVYLNIQMDFTTAKLPLSFTKAFIKCIRIAVEGEDLLPNFESDAVQDAIESQSKIGFDNFMVGFIANKWVDILTWVKTKHPHEIMEKILSILWESMCESMWKARNDVQHSKLSCTNQDELSQMVE